MSSIYLLVLNSDTPFYVGYTSRTLSDRLYEHNLWAIKEFGKEVDILELEKLPDFDIEQSWIFAEKKWIKFFKQFCKLDNKNSGGYCYPITASINGGKSSGKARIGLKLGPHSEERNRKISESNKGKKRSAETKARNKITNSRNGKIRRFANNLNISFLEAKAIFMKGEVS